MENIDLAKFHFNIDDVVKGAATIKREIDKIKEEQNELRKNEQTSSIAFVKNEAVLKSLNAEYNNHIKALSAAQKETSDQSMRTEKLDLVLNQEVKTIKEAREQNKLLNDLRNSANVTTDEGRKELELLNNQLNKNNLLIKKNVDQYTLQKINIGNYKNSIAEAFSVQSLMTNGLGGLTVALKGAAAGVWGMIKASLAFIATPIGAVIAVIGGVLASIITYLRSTQEGMDMVTKVTRPLSAVMQALAGILQQVGKFLFEAFSRPQATIKALYDFVKNQLMRQFEAVSKILEGIFTLNFGLIKEGFQDLADQVKDNLNIIADAFGEMGDTMKEAYKTGQEIDRLQKEIEKREVDIITLRAENTLALKEQENIMKNQALTAEERSDAIKEHQRLTEEIILAEEEIIKRQIEQLKRKQSLNNTTREELKNLAELEAQLISVQLNRVESEKRTQGIVRQLQEENESKAEQAIDKRINKEKELIALYIAQQGWQSKTLEEQLLMEQAVSEKKLDILKQELKAKKLSQEQYAREVLVIQQGLARMEAEIAVENASREIAEYRRAFEQQMEERKFLSDAVVAEKTSELNRLMEKEMEFAQLRLEQGLINQQEFDDSIFQLTEANRLAIEEINKEREAVERAEALELRALQFEEELERMMEEGATKMEVERAMQEERDALAREKLAADREAGLISEELYEARLNQIREKSRLADSEREGLLAEQKLELTAGLLNQLSGLIDQQSAAGKAIAVAQAGINTFQGITEGLKAPFPLNIALPVVAGATGLVSVKKIMSTKVPTMRGGGGGGSAPSVRGIGGVNLGGKVNLNQVAGSGNTTVQNQINKDAQSKNIAQEIGKAAEEGTRRGSQQGSQEGITNLSDNRQIQQNSTF